MSHARPLSAMQGKPRSQMEVTVFRLLGGALLTLGLVGLWIPVMPTTIFLIGAVACFARSSPTLRRYLLQHPRFGPPLRDWFNEGAIGKAGKTAALFGMGLGLAMVVLLVNDPLWIGLASTIMLASAWFVVSRPRPSRERTTPP